MAVEVTKRPSGHGHFFEKKYYTWPNGRFFNLKRWKSSEKAAMRPHGRFSKKIYYMWPNGRWVTPKSLSYLKDKYIMYVFYEVYNILCMYGELNKNSLELNTILTSEQHLYFQVQFRTTLTYHHLQLDIISNDDTYMWTASVASSSRQDSRTYSAIIQDDLGQHVNCTTANLSEYILLHQKLKTTNVHNEDL